MKHSFLIVIASVVLLSGSLPCAASVTTRIQTDSASGVTIEVITPFEKLPSCGLMPARIRINNQSGARRAWTFRSDSRRHYRYRHSHAWSKTFTVENQAQAEFPVFLPVSATPDRHNMSWLQVQASGYGCEGSVHTIGHGRSGSGRIKSSSNDPDPLLYRAVSSQLASAIPYFSTNALPNSTTMDFRLAPEDFSVSPQAYYSVDQLWVSEDEWRSLPPAKVQAVWQWVRLGGSLVIVVPSGNELTTDSGAVLPETERHGFGIVQTIRMNVGDIDVQTIIMLEANAPSRYSQLFDPHEARLWKLRADIGDLSHPIALVLVFTLAFAILLGPVNLIVALRRKRPAQMLWTTPVFSLAASIVLTVVILLKDGLGGDGLRMTLGFLDPDSNTLSTVQEQVSLTGVLLGSGFALDADTSIMPLRTEAQIDKRSLVYSVDNDYLGGAWFRSRSIQAQLLARVQSTRQRIELVPARDSQEAPALQSSVGHVLAHVYYRDGAGKLWYTPALHTGERKFLEPAAADAFQTWWNHHAGNAGNRLRMAFGRLGGDQRNQFYAEVRDPGDFMMETLASIRWQDRVAILTGPVDTRGVQP